MTFGRFETHAPADLKQLQELLAKATLGKWHVMSGGVEIAEPRGVCIARCLDRGFETPNVQANAALIVAMHEALPALLASHEALSAEVAGLRASMETPEKLLRDFAKDKLPYLDPDYRGNAPKEGPWCVRCQKAVDPAKAVRVTVNYETMRVSEGGDELIGANCWKVINKALKEGKWEK